VLIAIIAGAVVVAVIVGVAIGFAMSGGGKSTQGPVEPNSKVESELQPSGPGVVSIAAAPALPAGWAQTADPQGKTYYYNHSLNKSQYEVPQA
jgi:hypothetical protein